MPLRPPVRLRRLVRSWLGRRVEPAPGARAAAAPPLRLDPDELTARGVRRADVEALVGLAVGDLLLYEHALRHRSLFRGLITDGTESNERLEFLGDAVLGAIVAERLFVAYPAHDEGVLTRARAALVNGKALAGYATALGLGRLLLVSDNMANAVGRANPTVLADAFEAVVGALYLDLGFEAARAFVFAVLDRHADLAAAVADRSNHKSLLLEFAQARALPQPVYAVLGESGPSHDRLFTVAAVVDGAEVGTGTARSKKEAEQIAALAALEALRAAEARAPEAAARL